MDQYMVSVEESLKIMSQFMVLCMVLVGMQVKNLARQWHTMHRNQPKKLINSKIFLYLNLDIDIIFCPRFEELFSKLGAVANLYRTKLLYLFPAAGKSLIETSREYVLCIFYPNYHGIDVFNQGFNTIFFQWSGWEIT